MAGLETYDTNTPAGSSTLAQGDNKMRELAQKTCASVQEEHNLNGKHKFPHGSLGQRPAAGNAGRIYIVDDPVSATVYIQYDNGTSWVTIIAVSSGGLTIEQVDAALDTHIAATPLDHPNGSVTEIKLGTGSVTNPKIGNGALRKVHFDSSNADPQGLVASLVNGSELSSSWHTHTAGAGASGITFLNTVQTVSNGAGAVGWTNLDLTSFGVPDTAIGVILQGSGVRTINLSLTSVDKTPRINCRKNASADTLQLCGGRIRHIGPAITGIDRIEHRGQAMIPLDTGATLQYAVDDYDTSWEIKLVGYLS